MSLETYQQKRRFDRTPEPEGRRGDGEGDRFVVQAHAARRLHYDFRLELDGVLKSWAVPRGPSLDPDEKRLAVHVEDHPLDYGEFEGVIPRGEYGGGAVVIWDRGRWEPLADPREGYQRGRLHFRLHGEKLRGSWRLVRMKRPSEEEGVESWLLIKDADEASSRDGEVVSARPQSVVSGRTLPEVAREADRTWTGGEGEVTGAPPPPPRPAALPGARPGVMPERLDPQLATLADRAPEGEGWLHEIKLDGYRMLCRVKDGRLRFFTRNGHDWTDRLGNLPTEPVAAREAWLDGEVVILREDGTTDFQALQNDLGEGRSERLLYFAFDLLWLEGHDLRRVPQLARKEALEGLLRAAPARGRFRYCDHLVGHGPAFLQHACRMALEGSMAKRADAPYRAGRGRAWLKLKCLQREEVVIGGYTAPSGSRSGFGALLVGAWEPGGLRYLGRVGTGFSERTLATLHPRLQALKRPDSPFALAVPERSDKVTWVRPELVATVAYTGWTRDGRMRHPSFEGLREDEEARAVHLEPAPAAEEEPMEGYRLTNPDKVLFPEQGITKREVAEHYARHAQRLLPHLRKRLLTLLRCPKGLLGPCFYQKHLQAGMPRAIRTLILEDKPEEGPYLFVRDAEGLMALVQLGALELHPWGAQVDRLERPDRLVFDLDPAPEIGWGQLAQGARDVRALLEEAGLVGFLKTTGGKGLHVVVPIRRTLDWGEARAFCRAVAETLARRAPDRYTAKASKERRTGRIYVDWQRNARGATAVAPYVVRARPGAPVATPLRWEELGEEVRPDRFHVRNLPRRLAALPDPWEGFFELRQSLTRRALMSVGL